MRLNGGVLVANPVPKDDEIAREEIEHHIKEALQDSVLKNVSGKSVTPFLLQRIFELTDGKSLETNIALIISNAKLAGEIAVASASVN